MPLPEHLNRKFDEIAASQTRPPVWRGPEEDGITFTMLSRFLNCRERFRLLVVDGLKPAPVFNHKIEYGTMWHLCEEALAGGESSPLAWQEALLHYCKSLCRTYQTQAEQIDHWYNVCLIQFQCYINYWLQHSDVVSRQPLLQEYAFSVNYSLPSGRVVRLRGKWDSVDLVEDGENKGIWLQENKTKAQIYEPAITRQLGFDLQTMIYLVALKEHQISPKQYRLGGEGIPRDVPVVGVRYNVVHRPLSGGKGTIVRHKPTKSNPEGESKAEFYDRLGGIIRDSPEEFFARWTATVKDADLARFRRQCLDPLLESLCTWWTWIEKSPRNPFRDHSFTGEVGGGVHWRHPFGVRNLLDEGGYSDLDAYLETGSEVGLVRVDNLFPEL